MKKHRTIIMLILCLSLLPFSAVNASINDSIYILFVGAPAAVYAPTLEFEAGNSLKVIGASWEYSELTGIWQEIEFGAFTFFQAQVERSEPSTTTTSAPDDPETPPRIQLSEVQPAEETTKFLINLAGIAFTNDIIPQLGLAFGTGAYLGADVFFIGFTGVPLPGSDAKFGSIAPDSGEQESTLTDVTITGENTTFQDDPPVDIAFSPADGLTVSNISTISNTEIEFDLAISADAPVGFKTVIVTYNDGKQTITGSLKFEGTEPS